MVQDREDFTSISLIKGQFGGNPVTIAVDASGNIIGVLQGQYGGTLETLAVDGKGRLLAVMTDPEDVFGNPHYIGLAEAAVRLGGISTHDRRGEIIWQDSFESGTVTPRWVTATNGAASLVKASAAKARNGAFSMLLQTDGAAGSIC